MRVVISTIGSRGDVHPALALGLELVRMGHEVTVCAPPDFACDAAALGVSFRAIGNPLAQQMGSAVGALGQARNLAGFRRTWESQVLGQLQVLDEVAEAADLYVETSLISCGITVAETWGVPYRYVALCPTVFPSRHHAPGFLPVESMPLGLNLLSSRLLNAGVSRLLGSTLARERRRRGLQSVGALSAWQTAFRLGPPFLAADPTLAPLPEDLVGRVVQTAGMRLDLPDPPSPALERFLGEGEPPMFIGFGSMPLSEKGEVAEAVGSAVRATGGRAVVQGLGSPTDDEGAIMRVGPEPHAWLFPRCSLVVHHGGAGTTLAAATAGVPQVVVPFIADQHYWARRVHALGLGPAPVSRKRLADELVPAILAALSPEPVGEAKSAGRRIASDGAALTARAICDPGGLGRGPAARRGTSEGET